MTKTKKKNSHTKTGIFTRLFKDPYAPGKGKKLVRKIDAGKRGILEYYK